MRPRWALARSRHRPRSPGAAGGTAGTIRPGAARAGTSAALRGGAGSAGAAPPDGMAGATRASSTARVLPSTGLLSTGRPPIARRPTTGRQRIAQAADTTGPDTNGPRSVRAAANPIADPPRRR
jgi:hypothetical protein